MTSSHILNVMERTLAQLPAAAEKGLEACQTLLTGFFVELANSAANRVHFELNHHGVAARVQGTTNKAVADDITAMVSEILQTAGHDDTRWATEAKAAATCAFFNRLAELAAAPKHGGAA